MLGQLRRRRAYAPTSNTASQDNHEKINSWVSFIFPLHDEYGAPLGGPSGRRSSAINFDILILNLVFHFLLSSPSLVELLNEEKSLLLQL